MEKEKGKKTQEDKRKKWANRVVSKRQAEDDPEQFLLDMFYDSDGRDGGAPPVTLKNVEAGYRCDLHQAAGDLGLYHKTAMGNVMVLGSGKNHLGLRLYNDLNRAFRWPPKHCEPQSSDEDDEEDEDDSEDEDEDHNDGPWDITGTYEIKCPKMADCFGQYSPYTLEVFTKKRRGGRETFRRFDFGDYIGYFRMCLGNGNKDNEDDFILEDDQGPSAEDRTRFYRWRGKETGEGVIELESDRDVYRMTFFEGGRRVSGNWGVLNADPGNVTFTGKKIAEGSGEVFSILSKWQQHSQEAYDKANRDRWRRR